MTVGWQLLATTGETTGIQVWMASQHGLTVTQERATVWFDHPTTTVLALPDLFTPAGWPAVQRAIAGAASRDHREPAAVRAALSAPARPKGRGPTFGFAADGDLVVTFGADTVRAPEPLSVRLSAESLASRLSRAGRSASQAAQEHSTEDALPGQVDCARRRCVALTFDDGPGPYTAELVAALRERRAPATFFVVGDRVRQAPDLVATLDVAGMELGNHSSHHDELTFLGAAEMRRDLAAASRAITAVTGREPTLLRPPYGSRNSTVDRVSKELRLAEVLWDVDTLDWRYPDPARVRKAAVAPARSGSIVLMHDVHRTTVAAVPQIIDDLRRRGFTLVTVSELLQSRAVPGRTYRRADDQPHRSRPHQEGTPR